MTPSDPVSGPVSGPAADPKAEPAGPAAEPAGPAAEPTAADPGLADFRSLGLTEPLLEALADVGYESPSAIQAETIPALLAGADVVGQAQTGTGKTAAFALPVLSRIDLARRVPQVLVLVPTRELAIQVAEAFQRYAAHLPGFHVLPIYGGQSYTPQLHALQRGVHVVVGTPGRVMDHMERGTLALDALAHLVLDEADEMLQMGFVDAIEWILERSPPARQVALFSATLPPPIRRIAQRHLKSPREITIRTRTATAAGIRQRYWLVSGLHKLDALTRILEVEPFDAMLVFTRTKQSTVELAERLEARGFAAEALNGDIVQAQRERTIARLKAGELDIVVATDVAARGLDVERVSHVVNYDVPYDSESYVHRIGRTGRAGRSGEAILFIAPRERNLLRIIERATRQPLEPMKLPTVEAVNEARVARFRERIVAALESGEGAAFRGLIEQMQAEQGLDAIDIAAALASLLQGPTPLLLAAEVARAAPHAESRGGWQDGSRNAATPQGELLAVEPGVAVPRVTAPAEGGKPKNRAERRALKFGQATESAAPRESNRPHESDRPREPSRPRGREPDDGMQSFRVEVGYVHGVKPGNLVGAITNEAALEGRQIGHIDIREDHSYVDLPATLAPEVLAHLADIRVAGQPLRIARVDHKPPKLSRWAARKQESGERFGDRDSAPPRRDRAPRGEGGPRRERPIRGDAPPRREWAPRGEGPRRFGGARGPGGASGGPAREGRPYREGAPARDRGPPGEGRPPREGGRPFRTGGRPPRAGDRPARPGGRPSRPGGGKPFGGPRKPRGR